MNTPERILDSKKFATFMDWFTLGAVFFFLAVAAALLIGLIVGLLWWAFA